MADSELVEAYYRYQSTQTEDDSWAWDAVNVHGFDRPLDKWAQILLLLAAAPDEFQIGLIGAGPLEDLVRLHSGSVDELIAKEAVTNGRLQVALGHVWRGGPPASASEVLLRQLLGAVDRPR